MKILHVISYGFDGGGAENELFELKTSMEQAGHQFRVLSSDIGLDHPSFFADATFQHIPATGLSKYFYRAFNPHSYRAVRTAIRDFQPDVVHLHTMGQISPSVLFLLRQVPTVLTIHGPEEFTRWLLPWYLPPTDYKTGDY